MQLHTALFFACQAAASGYALVRGGWPERIVAVELALAAVLGEALMLGLDPSFKELVWSAFALDVALFAGLIPVALYANRYWPIWIAAFQLDTIAVHGVRVFDPSLRASVYYDMAGKTAYPVLLLLAFGTLRHALRVTRADEREASWIF